MALRFLESQGLVENPWSIDSYSNGPVLGVFGCEDRLLNEELIDLKQ